MFKIYDPLVFGTAILYAGSFFWQLFKLGNWKVAIIMACYAVASLSLSSVKPGGP